jgi:AbrB family looped-hinge helix DNA binding protein
LLGAVSSLTASERAPDGDPGKIDLDARNSYASGMKTTVSEKGQVTIPKALRDKLGLRPVTVLDFDVLTGNWDPSKQ